MSDRLEKAAVFVFCLGGFNPLCLTSCASDDVDSDCYDDEKLKSSKSTFEKCKEAICKFDSDVLRIEEGDRWKSTCGYYNFNGQCFPSCDELDTHEIRDFRKLYDKLCLGDRNIRVEWKNPGIFTSPPDHFEKPQWCSFDPSAEENSWIPTKLFSPADTEEFARFLMEDLGWEIWVGVDESSESEGVDSVGGVKLNTPQEVVHELSWRGALPELGLETTPENCGMLCALMNSINLLIQHPHLLKLLKNPQGHRFVFFAGTNPQVGILGFVDYENNVESSILSVDADKVLKVYLCMRDNDVTQEEINNFTSSVISHEFGHIFQSPPDTANIPFVYDQLGYNYLYLFLNAAFSVYRLSPSLGRGDGVIHYSGGVGFVSGYDQSKGTESFADEAAYYLHFRDLFEEYANEDAANGDYFLMTKLLFLGERLYCEDVDVNP